MSDFLAKNPWIAKLPQPDGALGLAILIAAASAVFTRGNRRRVRKEANVEKVPDFVVVDPRDAQPRPGNW